MSRPLLIAATFAALLILGGEETIVLRKLGLVSFLFAKEDGAELLTLRSENLSLRATLEGRKELETILPDLSRQGTVAGVFSSYPFNFRNVLILSRGADAGIRNGGAAVFRGVLVGRVAEVGPRTSIVTTLYDPRFELAVRIGPRGVDAIQTGGTSPKITLIAKDAVIAAGDIVTSADPSLPLGLVVGEVLEPVNEPSAPFKEAPLRIPYRIQALRFVSVLEPVSE
jgi:cell shape-determining protein MreC